MYEISKFGHFDHFDISGIHATEFLKISRDRCSNASTRYFRKKKYIQTRSLW